LSGGDIFAALRELPIDVVADALLDIPEDYPAARNALPRMAPDDVQDLWTGSHGYPLLHQSCAFVHSVENGFIKYAGRPLENATILDYGCGWGRLIRLLYKFAAPQNIFGCDPWDKSIAMCEDAGIVANLALCDYLPSSVPFPGVKFDLIYAFSVFTHLSEGAARTVLAALRKSIADDGLLAITIRPASYWNTQAHACSPADIDRMLATHRSHQHAYLPHPPTFTPGVLDEHGVNTFGKASFDLDYLNAEWRDWKVAGTDVSLLDPHQTIVFLKPAA
jgi:SAM-dependent methyltransferase